MNAPFLKKYLKQAWVYQKKLKFEPALQFCIGLLAHNDTKLKRF